jgi:hypothetical protein
MGDADLRTRRLTVQINPIGALGGGFEANAVAVAIAH